MATAWAKIVTAAMTPIDDIRLNDQLATSPALFYRRMSLYLMAALPLMSKPPELLQSLMREKVDATYAEYEWTSTKASTTTETTVETGAIGYDLCSCVINTQLDDGRIVQTPYSVQYDAESGNVTFPIQTSVGVNYELDFYNDGSFANMTETQIRLFAEAIALVWDERFTGNWLDRQPKIHDSSFSTVNEANWTEKQSQAHLRKAQAFYEELKQYEQLCAYQTRVSAMAKGGVVLV